MLHYPNVKQDYHRRNPKGSSNGQGLNPMGKAIETLAHLNPEEKDWRHVHLSRGKEGVTWA